MMIVKNQVGSKVFEFVAMKTFLEAASSSLEHEALRLELEAHIALDKLSTLSFEPVQEIKTRLVSITGRVLKVRDEIEHLLEIENSSYSSSELGMLLKAYFVEIDGTLNKLLRLREYVDDKDDKINKMLDDNRKPLNQINAILIMVTLVLIVYIVVVVLFSMNEEADGSRRRFLWSVIGGSLGSLFLYLGSIVWCKFKQAFA